MPLLSEDLVWWVTIVDLPALGSLFWLVWRNKNEGDKALQKLRDMLETRNSQMREALSGFKLEVAKSYASISDLKELEARLIDHLLRIEHKLDRTAMKTQALHAGMRQDEGHS